MGNNSLNLAMKIAPSAGVRYWTVLDWQNARASDDWPTMFQIFKDRLDYRFLSALNALISADNIQKTRRFGFAIIALDCLLIETLAQFYLGLRKSDNARCKEGHRLSNAEFYIGFLFRDSLKLKDVFDSEQKARLFYKTIRCGILHQGETTALSKIVTNTSDIITDLTNDGLTINRRLFHEFLVEVEFKSYLELLQANDPPRYRENMIRKMGYICHIPVEDGDQE